MSFVTRLPHRFTARIGHPFALICVDQYLASRREGEGKIERYRWAKGERPEWERRECKPMPRDLRRIYRPAVRKKANAFRALSAWDSGRIRNLR